MKLYLIRLEKWLQYEMEDHKYNIGIVDSLERAKKVINRVYCGPAKWKETENEIEVFIRYPDNSYDKIIVEEFELNKGK